MICALDAQPGDNDGPVARFCTLFQENPGHRLDPAYLADVISVVVPAHNEARVIGRLLDRLAPRTQLGQEAAAGPAAAPDTFEVIVVANGCTDDTARVAASYGPGVTVAEVPVASKQGALVAGDEAARGFPRIYVDADVELGAADIRALGDALSAPGALAAGPERVLDLAGRPWTVRWS